MMESEVPATGRVKQQAASKTAPQQLRRSEKDPRGHLPRAQKKEKDRSHMANQQQHLATVTQ